MPRPVHFEIHAANPRRSIDFCTKLFGWLAYGKDTEGNLFGMMQMDADAK